MARLRPAWVARQILTPEQRAEIVRAPVPLVSIRRSVPWHRGGWDVYAYTDSRHAADVAVLNVPDPIAGVRRALVEVGL